MTVLTTSNGIEFPSTLDPCPPRLPIGYEKQGAIAVAIPEVLEKLAEAFQMIESGLSIREVTTHLNGRGVDISREGLKIIWKRHRPDAVAVRLPTQHELKLEERRRRRAEKLKNKPKVLTRAEKEVRKKKFKVAAERRKITYAKKRLERLSADKTKAEEVISEVKELQKSSVVSLDEISAIDIGSTLDEVDRPKIFPWPGPQTDFLSSSALETLYGGAAGGGKSYAIILDPMRYFENPNFNGLLLRRTNDELRELIWQTKKLYPQIFPKAVFAEKASEWRFPSGGRLWMSYLDRDDDVLRYQGQAFSWIGFDELTQYPTSFAWDYLRSRLRSTDPELKQNLSMRATTNPGGPGHGWVKKMFIDPSPPNEEFWATDIDTGEILKDPETGEPLFRRLFIPAKLSDNPALAEDGIYRRNLLSMSEGRRAQLLDGDWTIADGAAFPEFRISKHVIDPFDIPENWTRFRSADWGYASHSCVHWYAIDPSNEQLVVYRELYVSKVTAEALADKVKFLEKDENIKYGVLDSSVWHKRGEGPSIAEVMLQRGCRWKPSDRSAGSRVAGKNRLHELLKEDEFTGRPGIVFFNNCRQVISDLQVIPTDPDGSDDIDDRYPSDHSYDSLRYGIMSRPRSAHWWQQANKSTEANRIADKVFGY